MDYTPNSRRLSDISHLFLSDVRKKTTGNDARPARMPPGGFKGDVSVDLTPEEFARMMQPASANDPTFKPLRAVVAHHLGETMVDRVRDLAVTVGNGEPVGIVYADAGAVRVCVIDPKFAGAEAEDVVAEPLSVQRLREVLVELDQDVCQWLLVLPDHRSADTQSLMAQAADWTLLASADHDGIVAAYRALKGVCGDARPRLTVNVFGSTDAAECDKAARKLAGVCEQFLKVGLTVGPAVADASNVQEICLFDATSDAGGENHWPVLAALADGAAQIETSEAIAPAPAVQPVMKQTPAPASRAAAFDRPGPVMRAVPAAPAESFAEGATQTVLELPSTDVTVSAMIKAVIDGGHEWMESPVKAPALPEAVVAVSRDRRLTLLAVAKPGLSDLPAAATALKWMTENRVLIAMALPQMSVDVFAEPHLHILVDHADASADQLQPLLAAGSVTIAPYRKVRWGGRMGLLLDAA